MKIALTLSNVIFPSSSPSAFRVQVSVSDDGLPMRIWLESKQTKAQWECIVKDLNDHLPKGAKYALPSSVIISSLQRGLPLLDNETKKEVATQGSSVDLKESRSAHMQLELTLKAFGSLEARYMFGMTPLAIEEVDILEAKIRDLEDALMGNLSTGSPVRLSLSSTLVTHADQFVLWDTTNTTDAKYFEFVTGSAVITIRQAGLYNIQVTAPMKKWDIRYDGFHLLVDDARVINAQVSHNGYCFIGSISHMMISKPGTKSKYKLVQITI
ncbi:hypothetical protein LEN26_002147 [Aphanomyces euteiches]|nr:hypothetical protein AeMF1_011084 [Aphanomyces euteiches]KAH9159835.1 hypothetical protein LEN26_002147 [Aphanomyces euteiches]KAH9194977.1 hypothetical protein AeNC1_003050 [Aphanomyces euteiches]